jgi:ribose/xylose/arabinose/galactoside ABC-type transport system permease subunit
MTTNMGKIDRGLRLVVAALLLIWAVTTPWAAAPLLHWLAAIVAAVFGGTALMGNCPAYSIVGLNTCPRK